MAVQTVCPRCGARDSFMKGYLPETCVCRMCQSQLDWREIPGCGPDCKAVAPEPPPPPPPSYVAANTGINEADRRAEAGAQAETGGQAGQTEREDKGGETTDLAGEESADQGRKDQER